MKFPFYVVVGPVRIFGGAEADGPGWYIGADGKIHKIPPRGPESEGLATLVGLASLAAEVKDPQLRGVLEKGMSVAAEKLQSVQAAAA